MAVPCHHEGCNPRKEKTFRASKSLLWFKYKVLVKITMRQVTEEEFNVAATGLLPE